MTGLKTKTIKSVLRHRVNAWLATLPEELRKQVESEVIVTGGAIASMLLGEKVNDIDVYLRTESVVKQVAQHYVTRFLEERKARPNSVEKRIYVETLKDVRDQTRVRIVVRSAGVESETAKDDYHYFESRPPEMAGQYIRDVYDDPEVVANVDEQTREDLKKTEADSSDEKQPYRPVFLSSNAVSLANGLQIILRFFGDPDVIHANYDFTHCTNYWEAKTGKLTLRPEALEALLSRTLVYQGSRYPVASLIRTRKFIERGWRINAGQFVKMALQISALDLTDFEVLEDQLTGVDVAYFAEVLQKVEDKGGEKLESAYLIEIIDRMFT